MEFRNKIFAKPFDLAHAIMFNEFPEEYVKTIGVPGIFVEKINKRVHLKDGTGGEMDSAFLLDPDNKILFERVVACLEHQSKPVSSLKLTKFGDYDVHLVSDENLPTLLMVASQSNAEESYDLLIRSPSDITKLYFLDLGEKNIHKRLSMVSEIIENNKHLSTENALNLGVILLYAPRKDARRITEKVADLYAMISNDLQFKMRFCLYSVISIMIDAYFDDEKEYRRLIDMVNGNTSIETKEAFAATKKSFMDTIKWTKEDLEKANRKIAELEEENSRIPELEAEIARLTDKLNGK